jgi:oligopeptide/dipeptide ABC transporter ATP-binding protein
MEALLEVDNLKKYFPVPKSNSLWRHEFVRAVDGVKFALRPGETLGLVGESGSGKTTIGRLILRLIDPTDGRIWFRGEEITTLDRKAMRPLRRAMQVIFQDPYSSLDPRKTLRDIIGEGLKHDPTMNAAERRERIQETMEKVGLRPEHISRYPHEFSGGQRQRIGIARAIILNPELVVADEPLSSLDVSIQAQVINLLGRLKDELGLSFLFISHDLNVVEHMSDRIAVMYLGKIVELAPQHELYNAPKHPYTTALLSAIPLPAVGRKNARIILKGDIPTPLHPPAGCRFHTRCYRAMEICSHQEPEWRNLGSDHFVACHLHKTGTV